MILYVFVYVIRFFPNVYFKLNKRVLVCLRKLVFTNGLITALNMTILVQLILRMVLIYKLLNVFVSFKYNVYHANSMYSQTCCTYSNGLCALNANNRICKVIWPGARIFVRFRVNIFGIRFVNVTGRET